MSDFIEGIFTVIFGIFAFMVVIAIQILPIALAIALGLAIFQVFGG